LRNVKGRSLSVKAYNNALLAFNDDEQNSSRVQLINSLQPHCVRCGNNLLRVSPPAPAAFVPPQMEQADKVTEN
jgi:hypothetical protein